MCAQNNMSTLFFPGGQLGLWVGISVITVCEIFGMISQLLQHLFAKCEGNIEHAITDKHELKKLNNPSKEDQDV